MASEYSLNLKATLDSSQVQQELQKLRQAQMAANNGTGQGGGTGSGGMGNFSRIDTAITKLNSTVAGLQRSIESLARTLGRPVQGQGNNVIVQGSGGLDFPEAAGARGIAESKSSNIPKGIADRVNLKHGWQNDPRVKNAVRKIRREMDARTEAQRQQVYQRLGVDGSGGPGEALRLLNAGYFGEEQTAQYKAWRESWKQNEATKVKNAKSAEKAQDARLAARQNRQIASMIGGQLIGSAADIATNFGYSKTGAVLQGVGQGVTAGGGAGFAMSLMGSSLAAGPIGILVGGLTAIAAVTKALDDLRVAAAKAAEQQNQVAQALAQSGWNQSSDRSQSWNRRWAEEAEKKNDLRYANEQTTYAKRVRDSRELELDMMEDPYEYTQRLLKAAEREKNATTTVRRTASYGTSAGTVTRIEEYQKQKTDEEKAAIDKATNEKIQAYQKEFDAAKKAYEAAQTNVDVWQAVKDRLKAIKEEAESDRRQRLNERAASAHGLIAQNRELAYSLYGEGAVAGTQAKVVDILERGRKAGPQKTFDELASWIDDLRERRGEARKQAFGITRNIQLNGGSMSLNELEEQTRLRDYWFKQADVLKSQLGVLEGALGDITNTTLKPDLSHVTSLAQYGFNMGEKDNGVERMEKYYSESINLQRQIKDKLNEGIKTEATYGD